MICLRSTACMFVSFHLISFLVSIFYPQPPAIKVSSGFSMSILFLRFPPRSLLPSSFPFHVSIFQPRLFRGSPSCCLALPLLHVPNLMKRCRAEQVWLELPAMISSMCVYVCVCDRGQMCRCGRRSEKLVYCFSHVCQLWTALLIMDSSEENND